MNIEEIEKAKDKFTDDLFRIPGIEGVGIGCNDDKILCLKIFISVNKKKIIKQIQSIIDDTPFDIVECGKFSIFSEIGTFFTSLFARMKGK